MQPSAFSQQLSVSLLVQKVQGQAKI